MVRFARFANSRVIRDDLAGQLSHISFLSSGFPIDSLRSVGSLQNRRYRDPD